MLPDASSVENIVAALEHSNRISGSLSETVTVSETIQVPFPAPTDPRLGSHGERVTGIPDSFLYLPRARGRSS